MCVLLIMLINVYDEVSHVVVFGCCCPTMSKWEQNICIIILFRTAEHNILENILHYLKDCGFEIQ